MSFHFLKRSFCLKRENVTSFPPLGFYFSCLNCFFRIKDIFKEEYPPVSFKLLSCLNPNQTHVVWPYGHVKTKGSPRDHSAGHYLVVIPPKWRGQPRDEAGDHVTYA